MSERNDSPPQGRQMFQIMQERKEAEAQVKALNNRVRQLEIEERKVRKETKEVLKRVDEMKKVRQRRLQQMQEKEELKRQRELENQDVHKQTEKKRGERNAVQQAGHLKSITATEPAPEYIEKFENNVKAKSSAVQRLKELEALESEMLDNLRRSYKNGEKAMNKLQTVVEGPEKKHVT